MCVHELPVWKGQLQGCCQDIPESPCHPRLADAHSSLSRASHPRKVGSSPSVLGPSLAYALQAEDTRKPLLSSQKAAQALAWVTVFRERHRSTAHRSPAKARCCCEPSTAFAGLSNLKSMPLGLQSPASSHPGESPTSAFQRQQLPFNPNWHQRQEGPAYRLPLGQVVGEKAASPPRMELLQIDP